MFYHFDDLVIIDPGTGSLAWTKTGVSHPMFDSGFGWVEEDTLVLVRDASGLPRGVVEADLDGLQPWDRTRHVRFAS